MNGFHLLLIALLSAGNAALMVAFVNRIQGFRLHCGGLRMLHRLHFLLMGVFPPLLIWAVGIRGPEVLYGGSWLSLSPIVGSYLVVCAIAAVVMVVIPIRRGLTATPPVQITNHSQTIDIAKRLGHRPIGDGPYRKLAHLPGNEAFRVEVSHKEYRLPRLPPEWDGLSILHLTDWHLIGTIDRPYFEEVVRLGQEMQPDLIVFTGDLLDQQRLVEWLPDTLGKLTAPLGCYFILGNHDWYLQPDKTREAMTDLGWVDVASRTVEIEHREKTLLIGGTELPWMGAHPDMSAVPETDFRLLLSHTPDHIKWARLHGFDLMLSGHNHGGQIRLPVLGPIYSPSIYGCRYASGAFWEDPTLLYVSRGISGRQPVRYRCLPELTTVVLRGAETDP